MTLAGLQIENPFPGLRPYEQDQCDLFFGREEQVDELLDRIDARRLVAVVGTSGSGKSSLVRAGLVPALHRGFVSGAGATWRTVVIRPGSEPIKELAGGLAQEFGTEMTLATLNRSSMGLADFARQNLSAGQNLLLVVDQFEEIFRYSRGASASTEDEAAAFVKLLLSAVGRSDVPVPELADLPVYIVLTMRSDFLGKCAQFRSLPEALNDSQYLVPRMTRDQLLESIEGPIGMGGARIAPRLSQRLLNDAGESPDLLPVLQHLLMRLWEESREARAHGQEIDLANYEDPTVGGMSKALNLDANHAYDAVVTDDRRKWMVKRIFQRLVEPGAKNEETRRPTPLSELAVVCEASESEIQAVIQPFRQRGFLTLSQDLDPVVDISHESLIRLWDQLSRWVKDEVGSASIYRRLAESAAGKLALYRDPELTQARLWREATRPNRAWAERYPIRTNRASAERQLNSQVFEEAMSFLDRSERGQKWRVWRAIGAIAALGLLTAVFAFMSVSLGIAKRKQATLFDAYREEHRRGDEAVRQRLQVEQARANEEKDNAERLQKDLAQEQRMTQLLKAESTRADEEAAQAKAESTRADEEAAQAKAESTRADKEEADAKNSLKKELTSRQKADEQAELANARRFAADALQLASEKLDLSLLLGLEGYRMSGSQRDLSKRLLSELTSNPNLTGFLRPGHTKAVRSVAFSPDGKTAASASVDGTILLWDMRHRYRLGPPLTGHTDTVYSVTFGERGELLASGSRDGTIRLWNVKTGQQAGPPVTAPNNVFSVAFNHAGTLLASGGEDGKVVLWDVTKQPDGSTRISKRATLEGSQVHVYSLAFNPGDDNMLASAGADTTVVLWNIEQRKQLRGSPLRGHEDEVFSVAFSWDGKKMASAGRDEKIIVWDVAERKQDSSLSAAHANSIFSVAFSPDGTELASGSTDGKVLLWNLKTQQYHELTGYAESVYTVAFSPLVDGSSTLASGDADGSVVLWNDPPQKWLGSGIYSASNVNRVAFSPDKNRNIVAFSTSHDHNILLWDIATDKQLDPPLKGHTRKINDMAFSPDGEILASASDDATIGLWDVQKRQLLSALKTKTQVKCVAFHPNGKILASNGQDNAIILWDVASGKPLPVSPLTGHNEAVLSVAFSPDGGILASGSAEGTIILWDVNTGKPLPGPHMTNHVGGIRSLVFSPDSKLLASGGQDRTIILWDPLEHREMLRMTKHQGPVNNLVFSPDGSMLASASDDKTVMLWDAGTGQRIAALEGQASSVHSLTFSPDGKYLASGSDENETLHNWSLTRWDISADKLQTHACEIASRNLTAEEWTRFVERKSDQVTCPVAWLREIDARALSDRPQDRLKAERDFADLVKLVDQEQSADLNNRVCWFGSIDGFARIVKPACEEAVKLEPTNGNFKDSLGVAQALLGNYPEAIKDFESFLTWSKESDQVNEILQEARPKREEWISALRNGHNPFDNATLRGLRAE